MTRLAPELAPPSADPASRGAPALRLERIERLEDLREPWQRLAEASGELFCTWEWTQAWCRHFLRDRPLDLHAALAPDGEVRGILPLYRAARAPVPVTRLLGHGPSDRLGPLCRPQDRAAVAECLPQALRARRSGGIFVGDVLPGEHGWGALPGMRVVKRESSPVVRIDGSSWEEWLQGRTAHFRQRLGWRGRRLERTGNVRYRLCEDPGRLQQDLGTFFALHRARWSGDTGAFAGFREAFMRDFAEVALDRGWLRLWLLEVDGASVAARLNFRFGEVEWSYQGGRDPAWERQSVGFVLLGHAIRSSMEDGMREYRLLRGDESYKARFASEDHGLDTVIWGSGPLGRATVAAAGLSEHLPDPARQRLKALIG